MILIKNKKSNVLKVLQPSHKTPKKKETQGKKAAARTSGEKMLFSAESDDDADRMKATCSAIGLEIKKVHHYFPISSEEAGDVMRNMIETTHQPKIEPEDVWIPPNLYTTTTSNKNIIKVPSTAFSTPKVDIKEEKDVEIRTAVKIEPIDEADSYKDADDILRDNRTLPATEVKVETPYEIPPVSGESIIPTHIHEMPCINITDHLFKVEEEGFNTGSDNHESTNLCVNKATHDDSFQQAFKGTCTYCSKEFYSETLLQKHVLSHNKTDNLSDSVTSHIKEGLFECHSCDKKFTLRGDLYKHVRCHGEKKTFKCRVCDKNFSRKNVLTTHMRSHTGEKPYKCDICSKSFIGKTYLNNHVKIHSGERPFECNICKKKFVDKSHLKGHMRTHTGEKPYKCDVCEKTFASNGELNVHSRRHTGERPYKCDICFKCFPTKSNYNNHVRIHTGEKPFECGICNKSFNTRTMRNVHVKTHSGEKPYKCDLCDKKYTVKYHLTIHNTRFHNVVQPAPKGAKLVSTES